MEERENASRLLNPKDEQLGVCESERFRVHLERFLPIARGPVACKDKEHLKSIV